MLSLQNDESCTRVMEACYFNTRCLNTCIHPDMILAKLLQLLTYYFEFVHFIFMLNVGIGLVYCHGGFERTSLKTSVS